MKRTNPAYWKSHFISGRNSLNAKTYKLELIEDKETNGNFILLMVPGYFQNAFIYDVDPQRGVSLNKWIKDHFNFHHFFLNPNGIANSEYIRKSYVDEIAQDDIKNAVNYLHDTYKKKVILMGHSNGAIASKMYLAGLKDHHFFETVADERQKIIEKAIFLAGNTAMSFDDPKNPIFKLSRVGLFISFFLKMIGWIEVGWIKGKFRFLDKILGRFSIYKWRIWNSLYLIRNVSEKQRENIYYKTIDGVSAPTLFQYSRGVLSRSLQTREGHFVQDHLRNIKLPIYQYVFEFDTMAKPIETRRDDFDYIGSEEKNYIVIDDQGHEDFFLNNDFHSFIRCSL